MRKLGWFWGGVDSKLVAWVRNSQKWIFWSISGCLDISQIVCTRSVLRVISGNFYRGVPHKTVSFSHWLTHIRVQHLVLGSTILECNT